MLPRSGDTLFWIHLQRVGNRLIGSQLLLFVRRRRPFEEQEFGPQQAAALCAFCHSDARINRRAEIDEHLDPHAVFGDCRLIGMRQRRLTGVGVHVRQLRVGHGKSRIQLDGALDGAPPVP